MPEKAGDQCGLTCGGHEIAAVAGVAVGTLYRHFPNKTDLVAAVVAEHVDEIAAAAEAALAHVRAGARALDELVGFLGEVAGSTVGNLAVKAAADALGARYDAATEDRAGAALAHVLDIGKDQGDIHPDVTVDDLYLLFTTVPAHPSPAARQRWVTLVTVGLTTRARPSGDHHPRGSAEE